MKQPILHRLLLLLLSLLGLFFGKGANAFQAASSPDHHRRRLHHHRPLLLLSTTTQLHAAPAKRVHILPTEEEVTNAVHQIVESCAKQAIASRGNFALAIPGGSVLKVLSSLDTSSSDWVSKTTLCFVNHKCVDVTDVSSAIEAQARSKF